MMLEYLQLHYMEILGIVTTVIAVASAVANLTPTDSDNKIVAKIAVLVDMLALNLKKK